MPRYLAPSFMMLLAGFAASCATPPLTTTQSPAPAPPATLPQELALIRQGSQVAHQIPAHVTVTLERRPEGWQVTQASLFFAGGPVPALTDPDLQKLAQLTSLESITIAGTYGDSTCRLTTAGLKSLLPLTHLRRLSLSRLSHAVDIQPLAALPELTDLDLSDTSPTATGTADLIHLKDFPHLRTLSLEGRNLPDSALDHLALLKDLQELNLAQNGTITDAGLAKLKSLVNLRNLNLEMVNITDAGLPGLKALKNLEVLHLYAYAPNLDTQFSPAGISTLKDLINLRELTIHKLNVMTDDLAALKSLPHLERLTLGGHAKPVDRTLDLSALTSLRELTLFLDIDAATFIFPANLQRADLSIEQSNWESLAPAIARLPHLTISSNLPNQGQPMASIHDLPNPVKLEAYVIDDAGVASFADAAPKDLRSLHLGVCEMVDLSDASLYILAELAALESLEIPESGDFSENGIDELARLKHLQHLQLTGLNRKAFAAIAALTELRSLSLSGRWNADPPPTIDAALTAWPALTHLESLSLHRVRITDAGLKHLAQLPHLQTLTLLDCPGITDEGLATLLLTAPQLQTLTRFYPQPPPTPPATASPATPF